MNKLLILFLSLSSALMKSQINKGDWPTIVLDPTSKTLLSDLVRLEEELTRLACVFGDKLCMAHGVYK